MNNQNHTTDYIKRQAKKIKKETNIPHHEALDKAAQKNGCSSWAHFLNQQKNKTSTSTITFTQWLGRHQKRKSPLGDLARDAMSDSSWPDALDLDVYRNHLLFMGACFDAEIALKKAWRTYKKFLKRSSNPMPKRPSKISKLKGRRVTFVKDVVPLHFSKRNVEKFSVGNEAWISWDGKKALPVIITEVDDVYYTFKIERPLKNAGNERYLRLDEVRSTPELACINRYTG